MEKYDITDARPITDTDPMDFNSMEPRVIDLVSFNEDGTTTRTKAVRVPLRDVLSDDDTVETEAAPTI